MWRQKFLGERGGEPDTQVGDRRSFVLGAFSPSHFFFKGSVCLKIGRSNTYFGSSFFPCDHLALNRSLDKKEERGKYALSGSPFFIYFSIICSFGLTKKKGRVKTTESWKETTRGKILSFSFRFSVSWRGLSTLPIRSPHPFFFFGWEPIKCYFWRPFGIFLLSSTFPPSSPSHFFFLFLSVAISSHLWVWSVEKCVEVVYGFWWDAALTEIRWWSRGVAGNVVGGG